MVSRERAATCFLAAELAGVGAAPPTSVVVLPVLDSDIKAPFLSALAAYMPACQWLAFPETSASPMRAHIGAALVSVGLSRTLQADATLALRTEAGAHGAFALARIAPPPAP